MTMYKKITGGWAIMRQVGGKWVQTGVSMGSSIGQATNGEQTALNHLQIRILRKRGMFLTK